MTAMKITRRIIDPITFVERVGIEFIPRIEDSALDDQLAGSMSYAPPKSSSFSSISLPPPPPPTSSPPSPAPQDAIRPPTPPKQRGKNNPNSPRTSITSPGAGSSKKKLKSSMKLSTHLQQGRSKRQSLSLAQIGEENDDEDEEGNQSEGSMSHMSALQTSLTKIETMEFKAKSIKMVRFTDEVELNEISRLRNSVIAEMFWASEDLANFRYEAFMEEAGLDINEFG